MNNKHVITIEIDEDRLQSINDEYLAQLWHVAQANPAPFEDPDAGALVERIGREIITRWLRNAPVEVWHHQGRHHYWSLLVKHGKWIDGEYKLNAEIEIAKDAQPNN